MRIRRLDLLKYGHFTNADFDLPVHRPDFHTVYGLNEAGKSTALCAIEDLLFGIPHNSPHNFVHEYGSLRVGALIEADECSLEFRRRKGNRDTLLTRQDVPLPAGDAALYAFLGGADRQFFTRMFCLDHARLRQGGREILEAQDDVGQILFSAAAGIVGLREQIGKMNDEANALWARRATQRKYNLADEKLKAAEHAVREHTVTASRWHDLRSALDAASAAYGAIEGDIQTKTAEERKLTRIRRVCRHVRTRAELNAAIEALGQVIALPEDASRVLESAFNDDNQAAARLAMVTEQIDSLIEEWAALAFDEALLARADDINVLHERRIQVTPEWETSRSEEPNSVLPRRI
ncbi:MAG: AAA family ATPase [Rhizomicrobium sp.]